MPSVAAPGEAARLLEQARKLIRDCRYHRRDRELAGLDGVVADGSRCADLPARVYEQRLISAINL